MQLRTLLSLITLAGWLPACTESTPQAASLPEEARKPAFAIDDIRMRHLDGASDDLATAGLGLAGLRGPAPGFADPLAPTQAELRRRAYYENYRALLAINDADGLGRLYAKHLNTPVPGHEYLMPVRYNDHTVASMLMVQVPSSFNPAKPCMVVTASSGSRGIYGAVGVVGSWALHQGCAVATTDKGTGTGFHYLTDNLAHALDGTLVTTNTTAPGAQASVHFSAQASSTLREFSRTHPHRVAVKHAHSGKFIERDWGQFTLQAAQLGFYVLNTFHPSADMPGKHFTRDNTLVLGAGISNGGGAILKAAEQDSEGWLDAVAVSEPNVFLPKEFSYENAGAQQAALSLPEMATHMALFGPCAALAEGLPSPLASYQLPLFKQHFSNRCAQLAADNLLSTSDTQAQAQEALAKIQALGSTHTALPMLATGAAISLWEAIAVNYFNSYLGKRVEDNLCNISYGATTATGEPAPLAPAAQAAMFGVGSGVVPTGGVSLINNTSKAGAKSLYFSQNAQGQFDLGYQNLRCLQAIAQSPEMAAAINNLAMTGDLRAKPTLIVQGAGDSLIQVNHLGRAYATLSRRAGQQQLRYVEISHGQHFDSLLNFAPMRAHYVPMHAYYEQALGLMLAHLQKGSPLPPSQYIQAAPVANLSAPLASLPPIALNAEAVARSNQYAPLAISEEGIRQ
ncbi:D-(-)-3-hydroxybutyrate oligomer hydrolase [Simiduia sp. 21SJ11W-1]|uniref:D-(-)-3-hydroxybutyrate oligomer hydrolase n=1 Tax=Simiduia sp. 21SJ11W-1 TaxID=2909669 RepID=UPI00209E6AEB|nr:D-(-)-3-hydroxybutyrate oligomer hydrolase [Simiduia sp. 21SJ11W-1]UTA46508.1 D-(-)-3-hydroxybutyrate oligomer hydrolase [Simiduia sp. 21SJ11W-1]